MILMQKFRYISATIFLGIFSMLMLHQAFPHEHHDHTEVAMTNHHSGDIDGDHHHDHENKEEESQGLLSFLFGSHAHSYNVDTTQLKFQLTKQIKKKLYSAAALLQNNYEIHDYHYLERVNPPHYISILHDTSPHASLTLRGPPYLV